MNAKLIAKYLKIAEDFGIELCEFCMYVDHCTDSQVKEFLEVWEYLTRVTA